MFEKLRFYTRHSVNDLRVNGQRTIFALLCIAAGVAAIVSLQTLGVMIQDTLTGSLQESNRGDIRLSAQNNDASEAERQRGKDELVIESGGSFGTDYFSKSGLGTVASWFNQNYPGQAEFTYRQAVSSLTSGISISIPSRGTDKPFVSPFIVDAQVYPFYGTVRGNGKSLRDMIQAPTDLVLSKNLADELDAHVGDTARISGSSQDFTVAGIVPTAAEGGFENFAGALFGYYYIDVEAVPFFSDLNPGADVIYVRLKDPTPELLNEIKHNFEKRFPYASTTTTVDLEEQNSAISDNLNQLVIIMGLVSLLIGGIGIVNTMLVIVSRRTTEVAVLKTIGLEAEQITILFLVEAILMGVIGSLLGIVLGWVAALLLKGVAGAFLTQTLTFRITLKPPLTGFIVGILVTAIFGFLPTLAAGQVRPNLVLRPSDSVLPKAGRLRSFAALIVVMLALSLVAQSMVRNLLDSDTLRAMATNIGALLGLLIGLAMVIGGIMSGWTRRRLPLRILRWGLLLAGLPVLGYVFGHFIPAILVLFGTFIVVGFLYVLLWTLIWSVGGGGLRDLWILKFPTRRGTAVKILVAIISLPVWVINAALIVLMLPFWLLGYVIQRLAFVDLKLALRSMLATKGRGASTLLALVIGVFTLSLITMLAKAITNRFEQILIDETGGNVIVLAAGGKDTLQNVETRLSELPGMKSYTAVGTYDVSLKTIQDTSVGETLTFEQLQNRVSGEQPGDEGRRRRDPDEGRPMEFIFYGIDARGVDSNLPDVKFYEGRQLNAADTGPWNSEAGQYPPIVISANQDVIDSGLAVGDLLTFEINRGEGGLFNASQQATTITFEIVGMLDRTGAQVSVAANSPNYAPISAFPADLPPNQVSAIVDIDEAQIGALRRSLAEVPGVFVLETKFLNDLINRIIDQFTSFPILVAGLALFTGGVVIANSVALSTLERRREIGIMKAVGLQRERVLGMLLLEYGFLGLIGGLIGVGIGGIGLLVLLVQAFQGELGKSIPVMTALGLMSLCVVIALVAAIVTAWGASGEKPLNVLRYE